MKQMVSFVLAIVLTVSLACVGAEAAGGFRDVPADSWAEESITAAAQTGILSGYDQTRFGYGYLMSRAAFATAIVRLFGWEAAEPEESTFSDVTDPDAWYYTAVETAYANGAVTLQNDRFRPDDPITREEMAVMIVRALGYEALAGLVQQLPSPFADLTTNSGYIAVAYHLGIVNGTSATTFSPQGKATREQVAVVLMRVYEKLHLETTFAGGLAHQETKSLPVELNAAAVTAARVTASTVSVNEDTTARDAIRDAGAHPLLYVSCDAAAVKGGSLGSSAALAKALANDAASGGYDGIVIDVPEVSAASKDALTSLIKELKAAMGKGKLLYVTVDAPVWNGEDAGGYDYAAIGDAADRVILRLPSYEETVNGFPMAPYEPMEELYYALTELCGVIPAWKTTVLLTTTGSAWKGEGDNLRADGTRTAEEIQALREKGESYYASRYESAYTVSGSGAGQTVVWYNDASAVAARQQLCRFFGVTSFFLSDVSSVADYEGYDVAGTLWG